MEEITKRKRFRSLSFKIGALIVITEFVALLALGVFYINRFTHQIEDGFQQKFESPSYLMSKGLLRYEAAENKETMDNLIGEDIAECLIVGANGRIYFSLNQDYRDQTLNDVSILNDYAELNQEIQKTAFINKYIDGERYLVVISPLNLEGGKFLGHLFIKSKMDKIEKQKTSTLVMFIIGSLLCIILTSVVIILFINIYFTRKIDKVVIHIREMAKGKRVSELETKARDEIGEIIQSMNVLIDGITKRTLFSDEIAKGNLDAEYEALGSEDVMGLSLLNMRKSLQKAKKEEAERNIEIERQNWVSHGLANFANILRNDNDNIEVLSYNIISNLIDYIDANQGGIFIKNEKDQEDITFDLASAVAYNRKKLLDKSFHMGEGLIGRCAYEKLTIYMTQVPENYIDITSGMGEATPRCILLVPLISKEEVLGVLEIASFEELEKYKIEFIEKLAENIGSTLVSVSINARTAQLLEQSQTQSEELAAQEEEMRQNLEELVATQEEAGRKQKEMDNLWTSINADNQVAIFNLDGSFAEINDGFTRSFNIDVSNMEHTSLDRLDVFEWNDTSEALNLLQSVKNGATIKRSFNRNIEGINSLIVQSFSPIFDNDEKIDKVLNINMIVAV